MNPLLVVLWLLGALACDVGWLWCVCYFFHAYAVPDWALLPAVATVVLSAVPLAANTLLAAAACEEFNAHH